MANDERRSETFIREVDEELRRDQLKAIWTRFAPLIIGACVLIVAITAGLRGWEWWQERKAAQLGDRFIAALEKIEGTEKSGGEAELAAIAEDSDVGYAALAQLRLAGEKAAAGAKNEAIAAYDSVAKDGSFPESLRDVAEIRAALLALDTGDMAGAKDRAEPLNVSGNPWRHAAREVIGAAAYQAGDLQAARDAFSEIQQDAETPPELWVRSGLMISLIDGQFAAPATTPAPTESAPAAPDGAAPETAPAPAPEPPASGSDASPEQTNPAPSPTPPEAGTEGETLPVPPLDDSGAPPVTTTP